MEEFQFFKSWPCFKCEWTAQLSAKGELLLFSRSLHDRRASPHFSHYAACTPHIYRGAVISITQLWIMNEFMVIIIQLVHKILAAAWIWVFIIYQKLGRTIPKGDNSVGVSCYAKWA